MLVELDTCGRYERVWRTVAEIPRGSVATYGQIADLAGLGRGARLVGYALRAAPAGAALPWHRVINAQGQISFPPQSPAYREQRRRLEEEGIEFLGKRVDLGTYRWRPSLDEILWKQ